MSEYEPRQNAAHDGNLAICPGGTDHFWLDGRQRCVLASTGYRNRHIRIRSVITCICEVQANIVTLSAILSIGVIGGFMTTQTYLIDNYTIYAASAVGAGASLRSLAGFGFPLFASTSKTINELLNQFT